MGQLPHSQEEKWGHQASLGQLPWLSNPWKTQQKPGEQNSIFKWEFNLAFQELPRWLFLCTTYVSQFSQWKMATKGKRPRRVRELGLTRRVHRPLYFLHRIWCSYCLGHSFILYVPFIPEKERRIKTGWLQVPVKRKLKCASLTWSCARNAHTSPNREAKLHY